ALRAPRRRQAGGGDAGEAGARGGRQEPSSSDHDHDSPSFLWFNRPAVPKAVDPARRRPSRMCVGNAPRTSRRAWGSTHQMGSPRRTINTRRANLIRTTSYPNSPRRSLRLNYPETQGFAPHRGSPPRSHLAQIFGRRALKPDEVMPSAASGRDEAAHADHGIVVPHALTLERGGGESAPGPRPPRLRVPPGRRRILAGDLGRRQHVDQDARAGSPRS